MKQKAAQRFGDLTDLARGDARDVLLGDGASGCEPSVSQVLAYGGGRAAFCSQIFWEVSYQLLVYLPKTGEF